MSNIAVAFKQEISRVSRKETKGDIEALRKSLSQHRSQIAALNRRVQVLERGLKRLPKVLAKSSPEVTDAEPGGGLRFSAKGLAAQRQRLGLSAAAVAKLLGVSALSVYKWESGQTRPRAKHLPAIAALRSMGRREAAARLSELA